MGGGGSYWLKELITSVSKIIKNIPNWSRPLNALY